MSRTDLCTSTQVVIVDRLDCGMDYTVRTYSVLRTGYHTVNMLTKSFVKCYVKVYSLTLSLLGIKLWNVVQN